MTSIRIARSLDSDQIRKINLLAFPESERDIVATLAINLLQSETTPETLSFVATLDSQVVGHAVFSPVYASTTRDWQGYILGPLAVQPDYQKQHIGTSLVQHGIGLLSEMGVNTLFVYGDPNYYGRFGFDAKTASPFIPPFTLEYPHGWLALSLHQTDLTETPVTITCTQPLMDPQLW